MDLISLMISLILIGVLLRLANVYLPMDPSIKQILNTVVTIAIIIWLLNAFGILGVLPNRLISMLVSLVVVGIVLGLINSYIPMASSIRLIINAIVIIMTILWLLNAIGFLATFPSLSR